MITTIESKRRKNSRGVGGHHAPNQGASVEYLTPPEIINALGRFYLDPCCPPQMPWPTAAVMWTKADNSLGRTWLDRVWMNPPYGAMLLGPWLKKLADHGDGIALVFARTETQAFHRQAWERADGMLFFEKRLTFFGIDGNPTNFTAGAPSVLIAYGRENAECLRTCGIRGKFICLGGAK